MAYLILSVVDFGKITKQLITSEFIASVYGQIFKFCIKTGSLSVFLF